MKKHLLTMALGLFLTGGLAMAQTFTIEGKIDGVNAGKAELQLREAGKMVVKYSTGIASDGTFTLKGKVTEPDMYLLKIGDLRGGISLFLDNSDIKVTAKSDDLPGAVVSGSATNEAYVGFVKMSRLHQEVMRPIYMEGNAAKEADNKAELKKIEADIEVLDAQQTKEKMEYLRTIVKSPVAPFLLGQLVYSIEDPSDLEKLVNGFDPKIADYKYVKSLKETLAKLKLTAIGQVAPDFTQNDQNGNPVKLSDFRGKYVLVDFWAKWCGPCRAENPNVVAAYQKYKNKNFTILGVSLDRDKADWLKAIEEDKLTWTHVSDLKYWDNEVAKLYGVRSIPANFLLDKKGKIVARNLRGEKLEEALAKLVK